MNAYPPTNSTESNSDISWKLLALVAVAILLPLYLLGYNVIYTEGEVMQGLFVALTWLLAGLAAVVGIFKRRSAVYLIAGAGGLLLVWQSYQISRWTQVHEEVIGVIRQLGKAKEATGSYPATLDNRFFKDPSMRDHISSYTSENQGFRITYFINNTGVSYWYDSKTGFFYYPD